MKLNILEEISLRGMRIIVLTMRMTMTQSTFFEEKMWNDDGD